MQRNSTITSRIAEMAGDGMSRCAVPGCGQPSMRVEGIGLDGHHCKRHVIHRQRHGSTWFGTFKRSEVLPYMRAAKSYIMPRLLSDRTIKEAATRLAVVIEQAPFEANTRIRGLNARIRADIAFGRLRVRGVKPETILAIHLAITILIEEHGACPRSREFRIVQVAKMVHRRASGYHRVWQDPSGGPLRTELHKYARSSGKVLRLIGERIEECCEFATADHADAVLGLKVKRYGKYPSTVM